VDICGVLCYGAQAERFESVSYTKVDHGPTRTMMKWKQHVGNSIIRSLFFISSPGNFLLSSLCSILATAPANNCSSPSESAFSAEQSRCGVGGGRAPRAINRRK
jgi:hypothetical protein